MQLTFAIYDIILSNASLIAAKILFTTMLSHSRSPPPAYGSLRSSLQFLKDGVYWFLFIPLGVPNLKEAVDRAIESAGPGYDALIDGVIYSQNYWYVITAYNGYKVEGTPIKTSELKAELLKDSKDVGLAMKDVLFHSSLGLSNDAAIANLGIITVNDFDKAGADAPR